MEFMNNGDLSGFIKAHEKFNKPVREEEVWNILLQSMTALEYIHSKNVIHRDIKPANLFMTNDKTIEIGDFGVAAKIAGIQTTVRGGGFSGTIVGTPMFMSPEILKEEDYDKKTDVYSMGISMFELCFFQSPKKPAVNSNGDVVITDVKLTKNQGLYSPQLLNILNKMIEEDKDKRPTSSLLCQMIRAQYIQTFLKTSSLSAVTRCLYSMPQLAKILNKFLQNNKNPHPITEGYMNTINNLENNINNKFNQFKEILAIQNPKLNTDDEIDPVFIITYLLEKMHKELNKKVTTIVANQNSNEQYIINSIYRIEEKVDKSNKPEVWNNFQTYMTENLNSEISKFFYGVKKYKNVCSQCRNAVYSFSNFFCIPFDLTKPQQNNIFQLCSNICQIKRQNRTVCEVCLTEQNFNEFEDYYIYPQNLAFCFYRGTNNLYNTYIDFPEILTVSEAKGKDQMIEVQFQLIGTVNRIINQQNEEEYIYFCRKYNQNNNTSFWYSRPNFGPWQGFPLNVIQQSGQIIMLFYNKLS